MSEPSPAGTLLAGRYRLGEPLGVGGQGRTYAARDEKTGRDVAVKELRLGDGAAPWKKFDLFEREVRVLRALDHPGIPAYIDHLESDPPGRFYLVMALAPGRTLRAHLAAGGRFDEASLVDVLARSAEVLAYLHRQLPPVVHRDIKPANLVRADDGRLSVVDFGGVRDVLRDEGGSTMIGTFGYMAPEQLHGEATPATDVYGLGATIVTLAGGVEPERVPRRGLRMDLRRHLPGLSPPLVALLERMVEPDPEARPKAASEVLAGLAALANAGLGPGEAQDRPVLPAVTRPPADPAALAAPGTDAAFAAEFLRDREVPRFVRALGRIVIMIMGMAGSIGLGLVKSLFLPIAFTLAKMVTPARVLPKLDRAREHARRAITEGEGEMRALHDAAKHTRPESPSSEPRPGKAARRQLKAAQRQKRK